MGKFPVPEILRVPLESISLAVKAMREKEDVTVSNAYNLSSYASLFNGSTTSVKL